MENWPGGRPSGLSVRVVGSEGQRRGHARAAAAQGSEETVGVRDALAKPRSPRPAAR
jgi:hypothetical protein